MTKNLAVDLAETRRSMLREPYSAAAAPDSLLGRAPCALPGVRAFDWLKCWPGACGVRARLPTATGDSVRSGSGQSLAVEGLRRCSMAPEGFALEKLLTRGAV